LRRTLFNTSLPCGDDEHLGVLGPAGAAARLAWRRQSFSLGPLAREQAGCRYQASYRDVNRYHDALPIRVLLRVQVPGPHHGA